MRRGDFTDKGATLVELLFSIAIMLVLAGSFHQLLISFYQSYEIQDAIAEMQQQGRVAIDLISREISQAGYDPTGAAFQPDSRTDGKVQISKAPGNHCHNETSAERIKEAAPTFVHFLADVGGTADGDGDGDGDFVVKNSDGKIIDGDPGEEIRYEWVGANGKNSCGRNKTPYTLYRDSGGQAQEVALNIEYFELAYFDESGTRLLGNLDSIQRASIRKVIITLRARTDRKDPHYALNEGYRTREYTSEVWLKNM